MRAGRAIIINDRSQAVGGASNLALLSVDLLQKRGLETIYFCGDDASAAKLNCDVLGLSQAALTERSKAGAFVRGVYNGEAYQALKDLIVRQDSPETIYHVHGWSKILSPAIFRALASVRNRTVLHAHDYFLACPNGGYVNFPQQSTCALTPMSLRCAATQCDKRGRLQKVWRMGRHSMRNRFFDLGQASDLIVVHRTMQPYLERAGVNCARMNVLANPVEPWTAAPLEPAAGKAFFFVGRLEPEKGVLDAALAARKSGCPLHVIGEGSLRPALERGFPEVTLHGWKDRAGIAELVMQSRAVVISSRVPEPFSLAALEAAGSGLPVIMPDAALIAADLCAAGGAVSFKSGQVDDLAEVMSRLAGSDELVAAMGKRAFQAASQLAMTPDGWGDALINIYDGMIARTAGLKVHPVNTPKGVEAPARHHLSA